MDGFKTLDPFRTGARRQNFKLLRHVYSSRHVAGLIGDLMKVRQRRMMQHQLQAADPHGGGGDP